MKHSVHLLPAAAVVVVVTAAAVARIEGAEAWGGAAAASVAAAAVPRTLVLSQRGERGVNLHLARSLLHPRPQLHRP